MTLEIRLPVEIIVYVPDEEELILVEEGEKVLWSIEHTQFVHAGPDGGQRAEQRLSTKTTKKHPTLPKCGRDKLKGSNEVRTW